MLLSNLKEFSLDSDEILEDIKGGHLVVKGKIYGGYDVQLDKNYTSDEILSLLKHVNPRDKEAIFSIFRKSVGDFSAVYQFDDQLLVITAPSSKIYYTFQENNFILSSEDSAIYSKTKSKYVNEDLIFLYVIKGFSGLHQTFFDDCFVVDNGRYDLISLSEQKSICHGCYFFNYFFDLWIKEKNVSNINFDKAINGIGKSYSDYIKQSEVKAIATLSGVDSANAMISLLVNDCHINAVIADSDKMQTEVAKSMFEDLQYVSAGKAEELKIIDGGHIELKPGLEEELEGLYGKVLNWDYLTCHTDYSLISYLKDNYPIVIKGDTISTGRIAQTWHTSLYKGSWIRSHLSGFFARACFTDLGIFFLSIKNPRAFKDIVYSFFFPFTYFDESYIDIQKKIKGYNKLHDIIDKYILENIDPSFLDCLNRANTIEEQLFLIQYVVTTCVGYTNLTRVNSMKSAYGVELLHISSDGPGVTLMLSLYRRYSSILSAVFPKQVAYDYYKKNTKTSFSATVKRAIRNCASSDTIRFLFFRRFFQSLCGSIERNVAQLVKKIGLTNLIKKVCYSIFEQPMQKFEDDRLNYIRLLWEKYKNILDLREYCVSPDIKNYTESLVQDIENNAFDMQIDKDRFINLSIFLSKFIKK